MRNSGKFRLLAALLLLAAASFTAVSGQARDRALFWTISDDSGQRGFLLGTIHSEDPRVLDYSEEFLSMLSGSRVFAMELVPNLKTLARLADYMHLPAEASLEAMIGEARFGRLAGVLSAYGVPPAQIDRMKPWAAMMTISVPPPETGYFMDFSLSLRASGGGLEVIGLETLEEQLAFLENMPLEQQIQLLDHAVAESGEVQEVHDLMVDTYLANDLEQLVRVTDEQLSTLDPATREFFLSEGIDRRNQRMLESLLPRLSGGGVFVAVGALHLPGEQGLLHLLRGRGFVLKPLDLPFNAPE